MQASENTELPPLPPPNYKIQARERKMMNAVALGLVISTLAAAGVWSPKPHRSQEDHYHSTVILKEGHRVIVVEYERQGLQKPISDASLETPSLPRSREIPIGLVEEAKEKFKEAASELPNLGQGVSGTVHGSKEKICDSYGACKEKISGIFSKTKEKISDGASKAEGVGKDAVGGVVHGGGAIVEKAKEAVGNVVHGGETVVEKAKETVGNVIHGGETVVEKAKEGAGNVVHGGETVVKKAVEGVGNVVHGGETIAAKVAEKAKLAGENAAYSTKMFGEELKENLSDVGRKACEEVRSKAKETQEIVEDTVDKVKRGGEKGKAAVDDTLQKQHQNAMDTIRRSRDAAHNAVSPEALRLLMGVVHLLAFAVTYGACVWVTFVSSHVLARALPRQQFGVVQSKIYPVYFRTMATGIGLSLFSYFFSQGHRGRADGVAGVFQFYNLFGSLGLVLANMLYLEPRATKVMYERLKMEKEEGKGRDIADMMAEPVVVTTTATTKAERSAGIGGVNATTFTASATAITPERTNQQEAVKHRAVKLSRRLNKLNTQSSFLNITTLMSLTWHAVYLAKRLHLSC